MWEAFRIFLDRVPDTMEYQQWVYACQRDSLCMEDLARNFSSTQEHLDMVASVSSCLCPIANSVQTSCQYSPNVPISLNWIFYLSFYREWILKMNRRGKNPKDDLEFKGFLVSVFTVWQLTCLVFGPKPLRISRMRSPDLWEMRKSHHVL